MKRMILNSCINMITILIKVFKGIDGLKNDNDLKPVFKEPTSILLTCIELKL